MAASIGRTLVRYSYLDWLMARCIHMLLGISIKQGRLAAKVPHPRDFSETIKYLLKFHGIKTSIRFRQLGIKINNASLARNALAHSIILKDKGKYKIQLVSGSWELDKQIYEPVKRALTPEGKLIDSPYLKTQRKSVETGIRALLALEKQIRKKLNTLNKKRRELETLDRRRQSQTQSNDLSQRQSSQALP